MTPTFEELHLWGFARARAISNLFAHFCRKLLLYGLVLGLGHFIFLVKVILFFLFSWLCVVLLL
jgi:hypothetical protein